MESSFVFLLLLLGVATSTKFHDRSQRVNNEDLTKYSRCQLITDLKKTVRAESEKLVDIEKKLSDEFQNQTEDLQEKLLDESKKRMDLEKEVSELEEEFHKHLELENHSKDAEMIYTSDRVYVLVKKNKSRDDSDEYCINNYNTRLASFDSSMQVLELNKELYKIGIYEQVWTGGYLKSKSGSQLNLGFLDGKTWPTDVCTTINCGSKEFCKDTEEGREYLGYIGFTESGKKCMKWTSSIDPRIRELVKQPGTLIVENYCRNPPGFNLKKPFCYINKESYEYCDIPRCSYDCQTTSNGKDYKGNKTTSREAIYRLDGNICAFWKPTRYRDLPENYCRNPNGATRPWCYRKVKHNGFHYKTDCDIPDCSGNWDIGHPATDSGREILASYPTGNLTDPSPTDKVALHLVPNTGVGWFVCNLS